MQCPKCKTEVADNVSICPTCKKVLQLECPNCHTLGQSAVCENCGYTVLVKCSKCSRINPIEKTKCTKCGFSLKTSLAYQECESDDFAAIVVTFSNLKAIKKALRTHDLYSKFLSKIKKLLMSQVKNLDGRLITYGNSYVINMNKELSLATSSNKAIRLAIKIINAYVGLNLKLSKELETTLGLKLSIVKKTSEELLDYTLYESKVKQLAVKMQKKYLKGLQIEMDQDVWEQINKEYKTDSLYAVDKSGASVMFYELILDDYIIPPPEESEFTTLDVMPCEIKKNIVDDEKEKYSFKVFDINSKCSFVQSTAVELIDKLNSINLKQNGKIITLKSEKKYTININDIAEFYKQNGYKVLSVACSEVMTYTPWGFLQAVFKDYYKLPRHNNFINQKNIDPVVIQKYKMIFDLILCKPAKASSPEDARYAYMEIFGEFLSTLKDVVIIIEGIEFLDDTSIQTLELYFDKFKTIAPNFVFINTSSISMHSKIKGLLRTPLYTEISLKRSTLDQIMTTLKSEAVDFIDSFYYEKLQENCRGSLLYFENVIEYLKETEVLVDFKEKLIVKAGKSIVIPRELKGLYRARIKNLSKAQDASLILAYSVYLGSRIDFATLEALKINEVEKHAKILQDSKIARIEDGVVYINNYDIALPIIKSALKQEVEAYLAKNILAHLGKGLDDATVANLMNVLVTYKEKYLTLWKNADFAIKTGDYDAYLKNCLGFLSIVDKIKTKLPPEDLEEDKKDIYKNILMYLYSYSPEKIYFIENILLKDAIKEGDSEKVVKLSNLMLQGALISANYTDALGLLHNILSRMPSATWFVDGKVNMKFLLLSLVHIEVLYNVGNFRRCVEVTEELLEVLNYEIVEEVTPEGFSFDLFVTHIIETLRLVAFAKLFLLDDDFEEYFAKIEQLLKVDFVDKHCIFAIKDFLESKEYSTVNVETATPFSKVVYLILQECSSLEDDYKTFAQNIYQAKLLAAEIHQREMEFFCDLLIGYAYLKAGCDEKAEIIYKDIHSISEKNAMFNMLLISKYFLANLNVEKSKDDEALQLINDSLAMLQRLNNQSILLFVLFEKIFIDIISKDENVVINISGEKQKLINHKDKLALFFPDEDFFEELNLQDETDETLETLDIEAEEDEQIGEDSQDSEE